MMTENNTSAEPPNVCDTAKAGAEHSGDAKQLVKRYEPTPRERNALEAHFDRRRRQKPLPRVKLSVSDGVGAIYPDHSDKAAGMSLLMEALGTGDENFLEGKAVAAAVMGGSRAVAKESRAAVLAEVGRAVAVPVGTAVVGTMDEDSGAVAGGTTA